ncbi:MAG: helix-turn-helix transcriptional regulator [Saprospiraceae bacterium]|nr:helix-turn-helix transcriptional regulator [Saprospiraceae bacterium]
MHPDIRKFIRLLDDIPYDPKINTYHDGKIDTETLKHIKPFSTQFFYVLDYWKKEMIFIHPNASNVLDIDIDSLDYSKLMLLVHPEDLPIVMKSVLNSISYVIQNKVLNMLDHDVMINFRIRKGDGSYIHVVRQIRTTKCDKMGNLLQTVAMVTDVTQMKNDKSIEFVTSEGLRGILENGPLKSNSLEGLTKRENQVLELLIKGLNSEEIGQILHISKNTIDTHRRNMLQKTGVKNTAELVGLAQRLLMQ